MVATDLPVVSDPGASTGFLAASNRVSHLAGGHRTVPVLHTTVRAHSVQRPEDTPSVDHVTFSLAGGDRGKRTAGWGRVSAD